MYWKYRGSGSGGGQKSLKHNKLKLEKSTENSGDLGLGVMRAF